MVRRQFSLAHLLLCEALLYAQEIFGKHHLRYADCLMGKYLFLMQYRYLMKLKLLSNLLFFFSDFAFYLLNVDEVGKSVQAYQEALTVRPQAFSYSRAMLP